MISVQHLTKRYGKFTAVNDVSFSVPNGEVFALLGPNGSGKTTTLKSIVGLIHPTSGTITINNIDVSQQSTLAKEYISYLPQRVVFPENLTAREVMQFYGKLRKLSHEYIEETLSAAQFNGYADKYIGEFSGGMIQRLGLAIAALPDAPILLLDEPTANLDPHGVKRFREFVLEQKGKGKTIVFTTHLLPEVEQLADRVGIYVGGKLAALESIENLQSTFLKTGSIEDLYLHYVGNLDNDHH